MDRHLIIELDGAQQLDDQKSDSERKDWLNAHVFK
ncbi:DUF559 domain-containing protein [Legionella norrlandica]